jgi:hypothetical protein
MASTQVLSTPNGLAAIYSVDAQVGRHGANHYSDVLLVQFFILRVYRHHNHNMRMTGQCDDNTLRTIRDMQLEARHRGFSIRVDGAVDPIRTSTGIASLAHSVYTIIWLNENYRSTFQFFYNDIRLDPLLPNPLRRRLTPADAIAGNVLVGQA